MIRTRRYARWAVGVPSPTAIRVATVVALALVASIAVRAQQVPDTAFRPPVPHPAWATATGPRLCLDEGHFNFHTLASRFWAFGELARRDGYRVSGVRERFTSPLLSGCDLLVISNAQVSGHPWEEWGLPTPSAFTDAEIAAVRAWVESGGRLLLIADHMPLAAAEARRRRSSGLWTERWPRIRSSRGAIRRSA